MKVLSIHPRSLHSGPTCSIGILLLLFIFCGTAHAQEKGEYWKNRVLEAHGGRSALVKLTTVIYKGEIFTRDDNGTVTIFLAKPGKLRVSLHYRERTEERILVGGSGWRDFGAGFEAAVDHSLAAMFFQYNHLNLPMGLLDEKYSVIYKEQKSGGTTFPIFELYAENEPPMSVIIEPGTGMIRQVDTRISMAGKTLVMGIVYRDYREVNGVMLPHRIDNYVNGRNIAQSSYNQVLVNTELSPGIFHVNTQNR